MADAPTLEAMLEGLADHHLRRTVADRWGLKVPRDATRGEVLELLLSSMRSPARIEEVASHLYGDLRKVLYHLALVEDGQARSSDVADAVFQGDLWRTKQSLEELHNYQLLHLARVGELQGAYPEYEATVPADLRSPLRRALDLSDVPDEALVRPGEPSPVHRSGWDGLRDLVAVLALAADGDVGRTQAGDLRRRSVKAMAEVLSDADEDRAEVLVGAAERLGLLVGSGEAMTPNAPAVRAFLEGGPARAQGLLVAGALRAWVPGTNATVGEVAWVLQALLELERVGREAAGADWPGSADGAGGSDRAGDADGADGGDGADARGPGTEDLPPGAAWLDRDAAMRRVRMEGLSRDFRRWFARSLREVDAFLDTVGPWLGLVDHGGGGADGGGGEGGGGDRGGPDDKDGDPSAAAIRLSPLARALLGVADPPAAEAGRVVVDPNLEVHLFQDPPDPARLHAFLRFAQPLHLGPASRFKLSRKALWRGLSRDDLDLDDVRAALGEGVPGNVEETLTAWAAHLRKVDLDRAWLLEVRDEGLLDELLDNDDLAPHLERLGPRHARVADPGRVGAYLEKAGWVADAPAAGAGSGRGRGDRDKDRASGDADPSGGRFQGALEELADALGVGLPAWLGGDAARFEEFYEV